MKPTDILTISEPVEQMYMDCQSQLIINICKHFKGDDLTPTAQWEFQKLSELDAVTKESIEIIAANTGKAPEVIEKAITEGLKLETIPTEKVLSAAANKGYIMSAANGNMWETSQGVKTVISNLTEQAVNDSNIVNTVMLNSTRERYINAVQNAAADEVKLIEQLQSAKGLGALNQQLAVTQTALNTATTSVVTGVEARTTAVRRVISELAEQGITGFVDRAGHHWSPEAYINMDIRTTVHNAAVQGQKARSADYGVTTFQISSHSGARPLCAPYQGKFYSWDNTSGVVEDLHGRKYTYKPINSTSYGEPAGIFGINCGHFPQTFVDGYSLARYKPTEDDAENAKRYQLMQRQRYMERNIRTSKTKALAYKAAGDDEAFKQTASKIASQNAQYKAFCKANGLTQRLERTQVVAYNKDIAAYARGIPKQTQAAKAISKNTQSTKYNLAELEKAFSKITGLSKDFTKGMAKAIENTKHPVVKELYAKYADQLVCVSDNYNGGVFMSVQGGVKFNAKVVMAGDSYDKPFEVAFHEFGHMLDWIGGNRNYLRYLSANADSEVALKDVLKSDYNNFKKSLGAKNKREFLSILKAEDMNKYQTACLSDTLEGAMNEGYPLGLGHGVSYHKRAGNSETEFFAEVLETAAVNEEGYEQLERVFPNAVKRVWEMVRTML